jgi:hypothetical protein
MEKPMGAFSLKMASLALSAVMLTTSFTPSQAFTPIPVPAERASNVETVQYYRGDEERWRDRSGQRRRDYDRYYRRGDYSYYRGHRGYRHYRPGYREYNGYWFPLAAFATGAIIGGALSQPRVSYGGSHAEWCANRYRSYRAYDNTYQPYGGPRRQCVSPY